MRGGYRPGTGRPLGTTAKARSSVSEILAEEQARQRRARRCTLTKARWQLNRKQRVKIVAEESHLAYRGWARIQYLRLSKAMDDAEAMDEVMLPDEQTRKHRRSEAQTLSIQQRVRALTCFYHIAMHSEKPMYRLDHAKSAKEQSHSKVSPSTILRWDREYRDLQCHFSLNMKGRWTRAFLLEEPLLRQRANEWLYAHYDPKEGPGLTITAWMKYLNKELLPNLPDHYQGIAPKSVVWETARRWLYSLGWRLVRIMGKPKYVDGHERPDVVEARAEHVMTMYRFNEESYQHLEPMTIQRARMWGFSEAVIEEGLVFIEQEGAWGFKVGDGPTYTGKIYEPMFQAHVDWIPPDSPLMELRRRLPRGGVPQVAPPGATATRRLMIFFQDESIFKAYDGARRKIVPPGWVRKINKKGEGPGIMITAFINESIGWLRFSQAEYELFKQKRDEDRKEAPKYFTEHEGYWYAFHAFEYGQSREGYWNGDMMLAQTLEFIDAFEFLYPEDVLLLVYDHSSGHEKVRRRAGM